MANSFSITNVNVFDGQRFYKGDVGVQDGCIVSSSSGTTTTIDGTDKYLLPGFTDCHVHLRGKNILQKLAHHGVTSALDMGVIPPSFLASLRNRSGLPDIRSAGPPATNPGSQHSEIKGLEEYLISDPAKAQDWVDARLAEGSDYIKLVADQPGPTQDLLDAMVKAAHARGKVVIVHAMRKKAFEMGVAAGADFITHLPLDGPLDASTIATMKANGTIAIPTLTILEVLPEQHGPPFSYDHVLTSFKAIHKAGIPIIAGSDSNAEDTCPLEHGECLHREIKLMVDAGFEIAEALRSATEAPGRLPIGNCFGLGDRGKIQEGLRADLVLLSKNPLEDIGNTRSVERVWIAGVEYQSS